MDKTASSKNSTLWAASVAVALVVGAMAAFRISRKKKACGCGNPACTCGDGCAC